VFKGLAVERVQLRGRTGTKTTGSSSRACVAISKPVYIRACLLGNDVNVMQLIVLQAARVSYSLRDGHRGKGRLGTALEVGGTRRTGIRNEGCSQKHCGGKAVQVSRQCQCPLASVANAVLEPRQS
jgi:hypothetical protein